MSRPKKNPEELKKSRRLKKPLEDVVVDVPSKIRMLPPVALKRKLVPHELLQTVELLLERIEKLEGQVLALETTRNA